MEPCASNESRLAPETREFYRRSVKKLGASGLPFLVGGAYAFGCYTGITRDTKDFDVFVHPRDVKKILEALRKAGYQTELTDKVWLGKAFGGDDLVDVIFSSGNAIATVDDVWFEKGVAGELLGIPLKLVPPEEMIWSKSFVMTRDRYDGADIAHLIHARAESMDWNRLLSRFAEHWRVLYNHLVLFGYIYPSERDRIPRCIMQDLTSRMEQELNAPPPSDRVCQGTLLSSTQYEIDVEQWGFRDARSFK